MTEWIDIVDDHNRIVGTDTRARVHAAQQMHRSAHIVLFNTLGEVFVQLRSITKDYGAGLWDTSAAGHVDSGETYSHCAVRELREELGIVVDEAALSRIATLSPEEKNGFEFVQVYTVCSDQDVILQRDEIDDGVWQSPEVLDAWIQATPAQFTDVFRKIWLLVQCDLLNVQTAVVQGCSR